MASTRELVDRYIEVGTERGINVTRVFLYSSKDTTSGYTTKVPSIGDGFSVDTGEDDQTSGIICRTKTYRFVDRDTGTYEVACEYSNDPTSIGQYGTGHAKPEYDSGFGGLPISLVFSGNFVSLQPTPETATSLTTNWYWDSDEKPMAGTISSRVCGIQLKVKGTVTFACYNRLIPQVLKNIGTIGVELEATEGAEEIFTQSSGCWMFQGMSSRDINGFLDDKRKEVELVFEFRNPATSSGGNGSNGWNKLLRNNNKWDIPQLKYFTDITGDQYFTNIYEIAEDPMWMGMLADFYKGI